jgi:23S rRNA (uracil1939-C5)-methyltransferase
VRVQAERSRSAVLECRVFGRCGGCSALDVPIAVQLERKAAQVAERCAAWLAGVDGEWEAPSRTPRYDRAKLLYPVQPDRAGRPTLGIYARGTHDVVRIDACEVQHPALTELGRRAERVLRALRLEPWDERALSGDVRALHARIAPGTGELLVGVVTRAGVFPAAAELARRLHEAAQDLPRDRGPAVRVVGVVRNLNESPGNALVGRRSLALLGRDHQFDRDGKLELRVSFGSFYQVHRDAARLLYAPALAMLGDVRGARVVDGYGGVGCFGLRLAAAGAARVTIVESSAPACRDAVHNAERNALTGVDVERASFPAASFEPGPDLLVVDPPRAGLMQPGVERALAARAPRILHVACSAASLARDLAGLCAGGYRVRRMRLVDLFPHTEHVEVLTLLEREIRPRGARTGRRERRARDRGTRRRSRRRTGRTPGCWRPSPRARARADRSRLRSPRR